jgi:hypothetical protein
MDKNVLSQNKPIICDINLTKFISIDMIDNTNWCEIFYFILLFKIKILIFWIKLETSPKHS